MPVAGYTIEFTYLKAQITAILNTPGADPNRQVAMFEGQPGGTKAVDFVDGTGTLGWTCADGGTTVSCSKGYTAQVIAQGDVDEFFTLRVFEEEVITAVISAPGTGLEGSSIAFDGSGSTTPASGFTSFAWDFDDGGTALGAGVTHAFSDNGTFDVTLTVTDTAGNTDTATHQITISNVDPVIAPLGDLTIDEGGTTNVSGSFTDAGFLDTFNQGFCDSGGPPGSAFITPSPGPGSGTFDCPPFTYPDNAGSPFTAEVFIDDDELPTPGFGFEQFLVNVNNLPPVVDAGLDQTIDEGDTLTFNSPSFTDAEILDTHTATIDWDGPGPLAPEAGTVVVLGPGSGEVNGSHLYQDDGVFDVEVCVKDNDNDTGCDTVRVTVNNLAPVVVAGGPQTIDEGQSINLDPATFTDAGVLDTHTATIDWGDSLSDPGNVIEAGGSGTVDETHPYVQSGVYTVTVTVTDAVDPASNDSDTFTVTVNNVAPTVDAGQDQIVLSLEQVDLDPATFDDPAKGFDAPYQRVIDWGDGQTDFGTGIDPTNPPGTVKGSHTYAADDIYTVTVTVTDKDGDTGGDTIQVVVGAAVELLLTPATQDIGLVPPPPPSGDVTLVLNPNGTPVDTIDAVIAYRSDRVQALGVQNDPDALAGVVVNCNDDSAGTITCNATGTLPTANPSNLAIFTFGPIVAGPSPVEFNPALTDATIGGSSVLAGLFDALVTVKGLVQVDVEFSLQTTPLDGDTIRVVLYDQDAFDPLTDGPMPWDIFGEPPVGSPFEFVFPGDVTSLGGNDYSVRLLGVFTDTYDMTILATNRGDLRDTLANLRDDQLINLRRTDPESPGPVDMGTLLEGNIVDDARPGIEPTDVINALDASAFAAAFGTSAGDAGFESFADFNRDGTIGQPDLDISTPNYLEFSPIVLP